MQTPQVFEAGSYVRICSAAGAVFIVAYNDRQYFSGGLIQDAACYSNTSACVLILRS